MTERQAVLPLSRRRGEQIRCARHQIRQPPRRWDAIPANALEILSMSVDGDLQRRPPMPILLIAGKAGAVCESL